MSDDSIGEQIAGEPVTVDPTVVDPAKVAEVLIKALNENTLALGQVKVRQKIIGLFLAVLFVGIVTNAILWMSVR